MEMDALKQVEQLALKKQETFKNSRLIYLTRAILASMFIGFGVIVAFKTGNYFYLEGSPFAYPMAAITFGAAIILIVYGGGDLFTGNTFYFTIAALNKKMRWINVFRMWGMTYLGNIIGAIGFAIFIYLTGLFADGNVSTFLMSAAAKKMDISFWELFFRAILCNWLICLAFFIPMKMKGDGAKLFVMMLFVFGFFISGYEHSIANMVTFSIALILEHPDTISISGAIYNLIPVTIGNIIGGHLLMGWVYNYINKPYMDVK
ncbi:formate/nitrite transporter family protein [Paraliobacillus sediminis]|uniref:formate/nitrite transporter family protein n=1 Tax=Paraliobacillus sediminis TaxID=1885916 RepID=UPI000E3D59FF|nr:formate/nitrite transporter family protein [Paraliobacillus sediminis]